MKTKLTQLVAVLLLITMIGSILVACTKNPEPQETDPQNPAQSDPVDSGSVSEGPETDSKGYIVDNIPDDLVLPESSIDILHWNNAKNPEYFVDEENNAGIIENAIYRRNLLVTNRLGVTLNWIGEAGDYSQRTQFNKLIETDLSGDCEYDIISAYSTTIAMAATNGYAMDLISLDKNPNDGMIDLKMPWWGKDLTDMATINGKLYFATGDISTNYLLRMYGTFFNKQLITDAGLESPYDLVDNNKWTVDKFIELAESYTVDDGSTTPVYGLVHDAITLEALFYGANLAFVDKDALDMPKLSDNWNGSDAVTLTDKMAAFCNTASVLNDKNQDESLFASGQSLFVIYSLDLAMKDLNDTGLDFGIVPIPKLESSQKEYSTTLNYKYSLYMISAGTNIPEMSAYVLEALASEGYRTVTPQVYDNAMKIRYTTDGRAQKMIDYIRDGVSFEIGRTFTHMFDYDTYRDIRSALAGTASQNWKGTADGLLLQFEGQLTDLLAAFGISKTE